MESIAHSATAMKQDRFADCQWIVFDAVGTVITPNPSVAEVYHQVGRRYGSRFDVNEVRQRFHAAFRRSEANDFPGAPSHRWATSDDVERARWKWIVGEVLSDTTDPERCFHDMWDHFGQPSSWMCYDDVRDSLTRLTAAGYSLAIASNFDGRLHPVCDGLPDVQPIRHRIVSASVQYRKPAPEFYRSVMNTLQCDPQQILMIGDDHEHDCLAPQVAGFRALHLDRKRTRNSTAIGSLTELADLMTMHPTTNK